MKDQAEWMPWTTRPCWGSAQMLVKAIHRYMVAMRNVCGREWPFRAGSSQQCQAPGRQRGQ